MRSYTALYKQAAGGGWWDGLSDAFGRGDAMGYIGNSITSDPNMMRNLLLFGGGAMLGGALGGKKTSWGQRLMQMLALGGLAYGLGRMYNGLKRTPAPPKPFPRAGPVSQAPYTTVPGLYNPTMEQFYEGHNGYQSRTRQDWDRLTTQQQPGAGTEQPVGAGVSQPAVPGTAQTEQATAETPATVPVQPVQTQTTTATPAASTGQAAQATTTAQQSQVPTPVKVPAASTGQPAATVTGKTQEQEQERKPTYSTNFWGSSK